MGAAILQNLSQEVEQLQFVLEEAQQAAEVAIGEVEAVVPVAESAAARLVQNITQGKEVEQFFELRTFSSGAVEAKETGLKYQPI